MASSHRPIWTLPQAEVYPALDTAIAGLTGLEAQRRLDRSRVAYDRWILSIFPNLVGKSSSIV